jgi:putative ABC transport system ATP-binding protein
MHPLLDVSNLTKIYQSGSHRLHALDGISFKLPAGQNLVIEGPSGSGKSTLMHLIGGLDRPSKGEIKVDGQDLTALNDKALSLFRNHTIGFVFQSFNLQPYLSAKDNVAVSLRIGGQKRRTAYDTAENLLTQVGLKDRMNHLPRQLSGGEQQRVAIARALAGRPKLLLCDEPTGNLDYDNAENVLQLFESIHRSGVSLVIVTHDRAIGERFGNVMRLARGKIAA